MRSFLLAAGVFIGLGPSAHALQITDARILEALQAAKTIHGGNPQIAGFALEQLVAEIASKSMGRPCRLSADPYDRLSDVICSGGGAGRPIRIQVKSGTSPRTIGRICDALRTARYKGVRMALADDTYANVMARCGSVAASFEQTGMLERAGISTARLRWVIETLPGEITPAWRLGARIIRAIPYVGAGVGAGIVVWKAHEAGSASLDQDEAIEHAAATAGTETFTLAAGGATLVGVAAVTAIAIPSAPAVVPVIVGTAAGAGVSYAIASTGAGIMVGEPTGRAVRWTLDRAKAVWTWARRR